MKPNLPFSINLILLNNIWTTYKYFDSTPCFQIAQQFKPNHLNAGTYIPALCSQCRYIYSWFVFTKQHPGLECYCSSCVNSLNSGYNWSHFFINSCFIELPFVHIKVIYSIAWYWYPHLFKTQYGMYMYNCSLLRLTLTQLIFSKHTLNFSLSNFHCSHSYKK